MNGGQGATCCISWALSKAWSAGCHGPEEPNLLVPCQMCTKSAAPSWGAHLAGTLPLTCRDQRHTSALL